MKSHAATYLRKLAVLGITAASFGAGGLVGTMHAAHRSWTLAVGPVCFFLGLCFAVWQLEKMD